MSGGSGFGWLYAATAAFDIASKWNEYNINGNGMDMEMIKSA